MSEAVPWNRISPMLECIRIGRVGRDVRVPLSYAGFSTESLLRTHLLPYLVPLKSERALAFELAERPELQSAVGLINGRIPSRATLWHFRKRNFSAFRCLMVRSLVVMAVDADRLGVPLPFVVDAKLTHLDTASQDVFDDPETRVTITICTHPVSRRHKTQRSALLPLPGFTDSPEVDSSEKTWLHQVLDFPIFAHWHIGIESATRYLVQPSWLNSPYEARDLGTYFGRGGKTAYTACNVLVLRHENGCDEVLLSRRLMGSGAGTYAVPGGKKLPNESFLACVKRELQEEVGIEYRAGRPISLRTTHVPGFPPVRSVGVVATEWRGKPWRREHLVHSPWKWYPVTKLPTPLFFPTQLAIDDFLSDSFVDLDWAIIEPDEPLLLWSE